MKKEKKSLATAVGNFVLGLVATGFNAWAVTLLWTWFAVATFGLPALSIVAVFGLEILLKTFAFNPYTFKPSEKDSATASCELIGVTAFALLAGYLLHLMM